MEKYNSNTLMDDDEIDKKLEEYNYETLDINILGSYKRTLNEIGDDNELFNYNDNNGKENSSNMLNNNNSNSNSNNSNKNKNNNKNSSTDNDKNKEKSSKASKTTKEKDNNDNNDNNNNKNNKNNKNKDEKDYKELKAENTVIESSKTEQPKEEKKPEIVKPKVKTKEELEEEKRQMEIQEKLRLEKEDKLKRKKIWKTICSKEVPLAYKRINQRTSVKLLNLRKISQLCQRETKKVAYKYFKMNKEYPYKCKRAMREMLIFWKRNEREEREARKRAEKEAQEKLRIEEEIREQRRQARKLNFLITQTELYSHFVGKKIQGNQGEESSSQEQSASIDTNLETNNTKENNEKKISAFDEIDFDEEDEDKLKEFAQQSAEAALKVCQTQTKKFDEETKALRKQAEANNNLNISEDQLNEMNFQNPSSLPSGMETEQPKMLTCQLKAYQLKGLNWLANLYEQGINGILADEMGLGKTVQSIALMAYLAEKNNIWGPFLVICPASTLHNWQQEITKFAPQLKVIPYWGNQKDRKIIRKFWNKKKLYTKDAPFHVLITSYQLIVSDEKYFQKIKWQYMILDEAQAIKSSSSARWKTLLGFNCRNRCLLTGTPIQNTMQELWALLHFIMPTLFDSHEEFSEWFSKDIESHAENKGTLNQHQLKRLHMILKPFMLRRIKRDVEHELGEKIELEVKCHLTPRQKRMYQGVKEKISVSELLDRMTSLNDKESIDSLMNLVMQFRKVCNHPELFERAPVLSPFWFDKNVIDQQVPVGKEGNLEFNVIYSPQHPIHYNLPKLIYRSGLVKSPYSKHHSSNAMKNRVLNHLFNIYAPEYIHQTLNITKENNQCNSTFSFLKFINTSIQEFSDIATSSLFKRLILYILKKALWQKRKNYYELNNWEEISLSSTSSQNIKQIKIPSINSNTNFNFDFDSTSYSIFNHGMLLLPPSYKKYNQNLSLNLNTLPNSNAISSYYYGRNRHTLSNVFSYFTNIYDNFKSTHILTREHLCYMPPTLSPPIEIQCSDYGFVNENNDILFYKSIRHLLTGYHINKLEVIEAKTYNDFDEDDKNPIPTSNDYIHCHYPFASFINDITSKNYNPQKLEENLELYHKIQDELGSPGLMGNPPTFQGFTNIWIPPVDKLIYDSGKLTQLDQLLKKLKDEGHRVLIFFQMVKMIDIIEEYLTYRKYTYLRLDGSTSITERNNMVSDWQTR